MEPKRLSLRPYEKDPALDLHTMTEEFLTFGHRLEQHIADTSKLMWQLLDEGHTVILEGAQGAMLDIDHGTYPFVTSSNPLAGAACVGSGIGPKAIEEVWGVSKAYTTRVGAGPFPSELHDDTGELLRSRGGEFGTTTGRARRTGWLDLVALRYAARLNTHDRAGDHEARRALGLRPDRRRHQLPGRRRRSRVRGLPLPPDGARTTSTSVLTELPGWKEDLGECRSASDLPDAAREYLQFISEHTGVPVALIGVGPGREQVIWTDAAAHSLLAPARSDPEDEHPAVTPQRAPGHFLASVKVPSRSSRSAMASDTPTVPRLRSLRRCDPRPACSRARCWRWRRRARRREHAEQQLGRLGGAARAPPRTPASTACPAPGRSRRSPAARGQSTYSAAWVGLGGYKQSSNALEQVGVDADCSRSGQPHYDSWYELIPAAPVSIPSSVHAGDQMTGSVTVRGTHVTLRLRNLTTGARYSTTRRTSQIDVSSADWILEAPSSCTAAGCQTLPLADFGGVSFAAATATSGSHTGPVEDSRWSAAQIELRQGARPGTARFANGHVLPANEVIATASATSGPLGAFSVDWTERQPHSEGQRGRSFGEAVPFGEGSSSGS